MIVDGWVGLLIREEGSSVMTTDTGDSRQLRCYATNPLGRLHLKPGVSQPPILFGGPLFLNNHAIVRSTTPAKRVSSIELKAFLP